MSTKQPILPVVHKKTPRVAPTGQKYTRIPIRITANIPAEFRRGYIIEIQQRTRRIEEAETHVRVFRMVWIYFLVLLTLISFHLLFTLANRHK